MQKFKHAIYIMMNPRRTVIYIGVTNNLEKRIKEHKNGIGSMFVKKYNIMDLVYFEEYNEIRLAIKREKQLKGWSRKKKIELIQRKNPKLIDLSADF